MAALLRRAHVLNLLDQGTYTNWNVMFSRKGWRKVEPVEYPCEQPALLKTMLSTVLSEVAMPIADLALAYGWNLDEFESCIGGPNREAVTIRLAAPSESKADTQDRIIQMPQRPLP